MGKSKKEKPEMSQQEVAFSEIIGDLVEQWGFRRHLGLIWSLIYLRKEPLSPSQIQEELAMSAGSVSSALSELQNWGVVRRIRIAGDRNFYYSADQQIWRSVSAVLHTRELRILEEAGGSLDRLAGSYPKSSKESEADFQVKRIKHIFEAVDTAKCIIEQLAVGSATGLPKMGRLFSKLKGL